MVRDKQPLVTNVTIAPSGSSLVVSWTAPPSKISYSVTIYSNTSDSTAGSAIFQTASGLSGTTYIRPYLTATDYGKYYFAMVQAINFDNSSYTAPYSSIIYASTLPATAVTMAPYTAGSTTISVSWTASPSAQSYTVQFYRADDSATTNRTNLINTVSSATSPTSYTGISSPDYGKYYYAVVTANNTNGNQSAASSSGVLVFVPSPPSAPTNVIITQVGSSASVSWTGAQYATSYKVQFFTNTTNKLTGGTAYGAEESTTNTSFSKAMSTSIVYFYYATVSASNSTGTSSTVKTAYAISYGSGCVTIAGKPGIYGTDNGYGNENSYNIPLFGSIDTTGNLYITSAYANLIQKLTIPGCQGSTFSPTATIANPRGSLVYNGFLYVCDDSIGIRRISLSGGSATTFAALVGATYITIDGAGGFYVSVRSQDIYRITSSGSGSLRYTSGFENINGIAYHPPTGDIYFVDHYNQLISEGTDDEPPVYSGTNTGRFCKLLSGSSTVVVIESGNNFSSGVKMNYNNTAVYYSVTNDSIVKKYVISTNTITTVVGSRNDSSYIDSLTLSNVRINNAYDIIPMNDDLGLYILDQGAAAQTVRRVLF
jgi:hypothetical protein